MCSGIGYCMRQFISNILQTYRRFERESAEAEETLLARTFERLAFIGYIAIPVHLLHIILFWNFSGTPNEILWRNGIILSHTVLLLFAMVLIGVTRYFTGERRTHKVMYMTVWGSLIVILLAGVVIVTIDQLVTTNITPFLILCVITAVLFLLPPKRSVVVYVMTYLLYAWALGFTQKDPAVLLSNRVNGLTAIGIAIALSIILWRTAVVTTLQEKMLREQKKALEATNTQLERYAFFDPLTNLYNRRAFYEFMAQQEANMRASKTRAMFLLLDIDRFKQINDKFGHSVGDKVLEQVGLVLQAYLPANSIAARWGGEEFLCYVPCEQWDEAFHIAESLRCAITTLTVESQGMMWTVTVSVGVALIDPANGVDTDKAYQHADEALYRAKQAGRNRVELFQDDQKTVPTADS